MMWSATLICAVGVQCFLTASHHSPVFHKDEVTCLQITMQALAAIGEDPRDFEVSCEPTILRQR